MQRIQTNKEAMETPIIPGNTTDAPALPEYPTQSDLRKALAAEEAAFVATKKAESEPAPDPEPITPEPKTEPAKAEEPKTEPVTDKTTESAPGTESTEQIDPDEEVDLPEEAEVPLSRGAKKRIAVEIGRQNAIQRQIDEQVSKTKALKNELAKVTTVDTPGSEPAPTTEPAAAKDSKPARPKLVMPEELETWQGTFEEHQTASKKALADYETATAKYDGDLTEWLRNETRKTVTDELAMRQNQERRQAEWSQAVDDHGADFEAKIKPLVDSTSEQFQVRLSNLDNWSGVAVHLAAHPEELEPIKALFVRNPDAAVAALGKLEFRLEQSANQPPKVETPPKKAEKALPDPPPKVGGGATANVGIDLNTVDPGSPAWKREVRRQLALKADG